MDEYTQTLARRLQALREALAAAAAEGGWAPPDLVAVTKTHPPEMILPLLALGQTDIGENRVQELESKLPALRAGGGDENFRIHLIGRLQTNKVKYIIEDVCLIQSLDRAELAQEIDRRAQAAGRVMPVLVQVSPAGEPQKGGVAPEELHALLRLCGSLPGLRVRGLMAVMPICGSDEAGQAYLSGLFAGMRTCFDRLREEALPGIEMETLSMGMSDDCLLAARHGATMVRVGSRLFGPRA